ncbi:hypothetical protein PF007_g24927 [Phytophthora fragariae]|uniref:Retrotransposon gag domain-containing protein n=1 Tax=Phytophthora fragariae TaxID=53985 RepID=A0A6A3QG83_9STRA|nr:hypothetical protein PF007_g24927 [Phytophthora fragariae]KAE9094948.1 hypothetical protein PF006_g24106 [Phytophthora fragariae]
MTTSGETTGSVRDACALRRASLIPTAMSPTQSKRQRTAAEITLDTGNRGSARLASASVCVSSGNTPQPRQSNTGSTVSDQTTTPSRTANLMVGSRDHNEGEPRAVRFTSDPAPPQQQPVRPSLAGHGDGQHRDDQHDDQRDDQFDSNEHGFGGYLGNEGDRTQSADTRADPPTQPARLSEPPPPATPTWSSTRATPLAMAPTREVIREFRGRKKMRLPKFKGLYGTMAVSTWLRAVQTETRRQERKLGVHWDVDEVYFEMASHLEGEALRWYGNIMSAITDETDENLPRLLRGRYGEQRSDPEVVASRNDRKQMRGEPLVEYAAALREIVADRSIGEEWLVDTLLNGMSNSSSATHVRGREPQTLDEAVRVATKQVGRFGESHRVGLEAAMAKQDKRAGGTSRNTSTPLGAAAPLGLGGKEQSAAVGDLSLGGFGNALAMQKPPRYDVDGRLISPVGAADWGPGIAMVPQGYTLVPLGTQTGSETKTQTSSNKEGRPPTANRRPRGDGGSNQGRRSGRMLKVEGQGSQRAPLGVRDEASRRAGHHSSRHLRLAQATECATTAGTRGTSPESAD